VKCRLSTLRNVLENVWRSLLGLVRSRDWLQSKISPLFIPVYFVLGEQSVPFRDGLLLACGLFAYFLTTASLGFFLNDLGDIDSDFRAGKRNVSAALSRRNQALIAAALFCLSIGSVFLLPGSRLLYILVAAEVLCFVGYSFRPLRLKERAIGVLVDTMYAHVIPFAISITAASHVSPSDLSSWEGIAVLALSWQFVQGMRLILAHQIGDYHGDLRANVPTFAVRIGIRKARLLQGTLLPVLETVILLSLLAAAPRSVTLLALYLTFLSLTLLRCGRAMARGYRPGLDWHFFDLISNSFSMTWMPTFFLILLSASNPRYLLLLVAHLSVFGLPRIESPPSPPSWHVDIEQGPDPDVCAVRGWTLLSVMAPERVEVLLDGWPVSSAQIESAPAGLAEQFSLPDSAIGSFDPSVPLDSLPPGRLAAEIRVCAVLSGRGRALLKKTELELAPGRVPAVEEDWSNVYRRDWRPELRRDADGLPEKILLLHSSPASAAFVEPGFRDALERRRFRVLKARPGEASGDIARMALEADLPASVLFLPLEDVTIETIRRLQARGWCAVAFSIVSDTNCRVPSGVREELDFFGPFTTPVFERFAARYLGAEPPLDTGLVEEAKAA
jgi:4-hydroxybenzoate polyprenyltransferase